MQETILRVKDLTKYYTMSSKTIFSEAKVNKANDGITLDILEGETLGLVGESGSGKSTLGKVLLQLYEQTGGSTYYYGKRLEELAPQYVFSIIKNLEKDVKSLESNRIDRRKLKSQLKDDLDEKSYAKIEKEFNRVDKKIDEFFDTSVKIFGGLVFSEDLSKVSKTMLEWYKVKGQIIEKTKKIGVKELGIHALVEQEQEESKKASKLNDEIKVLKEDLLSLNAQLQRLEKIQYEQRLSAQDNPKYEKYESRKDTGVDLARLSEKEMRSLRNDVQIIFQDPYSSLDPRMTVAQIIGEALVANDLYKKNTQKLTNYIAEVMVECGLKPEMMHRYPHQFSGGQRQRIGIARALAVNPKFIVADEAVSALDVSIQLQIIDLLKKLKEERNLTYLFISHDLGVVRFISDRIAVMNKGHLVELASTKEIFENPLHPYTKQLLRAIPRFNPEPLQFNNHYNVKHDFIAYETENKIDAEWVEAYKDHFIACRLLEEEK